MKFLNCLLVVFQGLSAAWLLNFLQSQVSDPAFQIPKLYCSDHLFSSFSTCGFCLVLRIFVLSYGHRIIRKRNAIV